MELKSLTYMILVLVSTCKPADYKGENNGLTFKTRRSRSLSLLSLLPPLHLTRRADHLPIAASRWPAGFRCQAQPRPSVVFFWVLNRVIAVNLVDPP